MGRTAKKRSGSPSSIYWDIGGSNTLRLIETFIHGGHKEDSAFQFNSGDVTSTNYWTAKDVTVWSQQNEVNIIKTDEIMNSSSNARYPLSVDIGSLIAGLQTQMIWNSQKSNDNCCS